MKNELCPASTAALSGLITDLDQRGLLDETLVLVLSEHGRTPKLNNAKGGGRDHWSQAYTRCLAGGGVARGQVVGKTDKIAGDRGRPAGVAEGRAGDRVPPARHRPRTRCLTDRTGRPAAAGGWPRGAGDAGGSSPEYHGEV